MIKKGKLNHKQVAQRLKCRNNDLLNEEILFFFYFLVISCTLEGQEIFIEKNI